MDGSGEGEDDDSVEFLGVSVPGQECIIKREGEEKTYRVEDFCAPPGGVVFGGEISELPSPVINLEVKLSKLAIS